MVTSTEEYGSSWTVLLDPEGNEFCVTSVAWLVVRVPRPGRDDGAPSYPRIRLILENPARGAPSRP